MISTKNISKAPAEILYADELDALQQNDNGPKPPGWLLSPHFVRSFITGSDGKPLLYTKDGKEQQCTISKKFYGDDVLVERCIVTLMGNRGLLLVGEPGTAKSMLSELLSAAISGDSKNTVQGTAGVTEDQIKYSWNYALLLAEGPSLKALVEAPVYKGLNNGSLVRFEELTRCAPEIQDSLISVMSDKVMHIPELGDEGILLANKGFNVIGTANIRDKGVNDMSSALKRRFNFETVHPIANKKMEVELVKRQTEQFLRDQETPFEVDEDIIDILVTTFHDLRNGRTSEGIIVDKPSTIMSTAEAVAVGISSSLDAHYLGTGKADPSHIVRQLKGTVLKDNPDDQKKLQHYFDVVVKSRGKNDRLWKSYYDARSWLRH